MKDKLDVMTHDKTLDQINKRAYFKNNLPGFVDFEVINHRRVKTATDTMRPPKEGSLFNLYPEKK